MWGYSQLRHRVPSHTPCFSLDSASGHLVPSLRCSGRDSPCHLFELSRRQWIKFGHELHFVERQKRRNTVLNFAALTGWCRTIPSLWWKMFSVWGPGINIFSPRNFPVPLEFSSHVSLKILQRFVHRLGSNYLCLLHITLTQQRSTTTTTNSTLETSKKFNLTIFWRSQNIFLVRGRKPEVNTSQVSSTSG